LLHAIALQSSSSTTKNSIIALDFAFGQLGKY